MNGLEALKLMMDGKIVCGEFPKGKFLLKIADGIVVSKNLDEPQPVWRNENMFILEHSYQEYVPPKVTGWERDGEKRSYYVINVFDVEHVPDFNYLADDLAYNQANYFSTKEKCEEINFKQTLFRKLQRFADENNEEEIDWNNDAIPKYYITVWFPGRELRVTHLYCHNDFGQVYFSSREVAEKAMVLFKKDLCKYFGI